MKHRFVRVRDSMIAAARTQGYPIGDIAQSLQISVNAVWLSLHRTETKMGGQGIFGPASDRHEEIEADYRSGMTLESIGMKVGVTRERIRQILKMRGVKPNEGGRAVVSMLSVADRREARDARKEYVEARCFKLFKCSYEQAQKINDGLHPSRIVGTKSYNYISQVRNAEGRGIKFSLTFPEWWEIWESSGHWDERGRGKGRYCMGRIGDVGGYAIGNVEIIKHEQNSADFYKNVNRKVRDELNLTPRQRDVYNRLVQGFGVSEIAEQTGMKYGTTTCYVAQIRRTFPELRKAA